MRISAVPVLFLAAAGVAAVATGGCKREETPPPQGAAAPSAPPAAATPPPAGNATIKGTVTLSGPAPERKDVNMKADPYCAKQGDTKDEEVVVGPGGGLKNVVVRIATGLAGQ